MNDSSSSHHQQFNPSSLTESISASRLDAVAQLLSSIGGGGSQQQQNHQNRQQNNNNQENPSSLRKVFSPHPDNPNRIQNQNHIPAPNVLDYSQLHAAAQMKAKQRQLQAQQTFMLHQNNNNIDNNNIPPSVSDVAKNSSAASPAIPQQNFNSGYYGYLYLPNDNTNSSVPNGNNNNENDRSTQDKRQRKNTNNPSARTASSQTSSSSVANWSDIDAISEDDRNHNNSNVVVQPQHTATTTTTKKRATDDTSIKQHVLTASRKKPESPELSHPRKRTARPDDSFGSIGYAFSALAAHKKRQAEAELRAIKYDELLRQPVSPARNNNNNNNNTHVAVAGQTKEQPQKHRETLPTTTIPLRTTMNKNINNISPLTNAVIQDYPLPTSVALKYNSKFGATSSIPLAPRQQQQAKLIVQQPQPQQNHQNVLYHNPRAPVMPSADFFTVPPPHQQIQQQNIQQHRQFSPTGPSLPIPDTSNFIQLLQQHHHQQQQHFVDPHHNSNLLPPSPVPKRKFISVDDLLHQKALQELNNNNTNQNQNQKPTSSTPTNDNQHLMSDSVDAKILQLLQRRVLVDKNEEENEIMYEKDYERKLLLQQFAALELEKIKRSEGKLNDDDPEVQMLRKILLENKHDPHSNNNNSSKFVFNDSDGSFLQVAMPNIAHETIDHRTLLKAVAREPERMLVPDDGGSPHQGKMETRGFYTTNEEEYENDSSSQDNDKYLSVVKNNNHNNNSASSAFRSDIVAASSLSLFSRPEQHRISGVNDSFAFAQKSRVSAKQESYNNPENFQQTTLAGKELILADAGQVETTKNRSKNDPLNEFAPDLALAQRDFASRAQLVRQKVSETRILMALKAIRDTEERERLVLRAAEAVERGTHHLLVKHLGNRIKYIAEEAEERENIAKLRTQDLLFVGKKVRHRKEEDEMRKRISDEEQENFRRLLKNLQKTLEVHFAMMKLVQEVEPRHRQFLVSESISAMNFLMLRSCEIIEEKHRTFLMVGYWCSTDESLEEIQEQFDQFFESSASARRVRSAIGGEKKKKNKNSFTGWIGPAVPSRGQFCDDFHDSIVSNQNDSSSSSSSLFGRFYKTSSSTKNKNSNNKNNKIMSDAEIIFAELNRASKRLFAFANGHHDDDESDENQNTDNPRRRNPPISPAQQPEIIMTKFDNFTDKKVNQNQIDRQNSLNPLWSAAEGAKRAQLSAQIAALRRGEDLTYSAFSTRHYRGPGGYLEDHQQQHLQFSNRNNANENNYLIYSSSAPDNFGPSQQKRQQQIHQEEEAENFSSTSSSPIFEITNIEGLHYATSAILSWHGWLPVSLYYSVIIPYARLLRDEAVSRLALQEGQEVKLQTLLATRAVDIGNRMFRALKSQGIEAAMKLATSKVEKVPVRLFGGVNSNNQTSPRRNSSNASNDDENSSSSNYHHPQQHDISSIALRHDLKMFRLCDPDRQGFVSFPSVLAVLRSSPDLVGVGKDVFSCCSVEDLAVMFTRNSSSHHHPDDLEQQQVSTIVLTFPEFRNFMQHLRQVMSY